MYDFSDFAASSMDPHFMLKQQHIEAQKAKLTALGKGKPLQGSDVANVCGKISSSSSYRKDSAPQSASKRKSDDIGAHNEPLDGKG